MMKHIWKILAVAALLLVAAVAATGCSQWTPMYEQMDRDGYTVSVRFDANGGNIGGGTGEVYVVDVFNLNDFRADGNGIVHIPILPLEHDSRKKGSEPLSVVKNGYFLDGWYVAYPMTDEAGNPLDENGQPITSEDQKQGYVYGEKWDFNTSRLKVDTSKEYSAGEAVLTLRAVWLPLINFEIYELDESGNPSLLGTVKNQKEIQMPAWNMDTGKMDLLGFSLIEGFTGVSGKTFEAAYMDAEMTTPITDKVDYTSGSKEEGGNVIRIYTTWQEGTWFRISTPDQLYNNASANGCYELEADLDFTGKLWPTVFSTGEFNGTIRGNGHTVSNITVQQGDNSKINGGLFGVLGSKAKISDLKLENATFKMVAGSRMTGANYGLLAGTANEGATLTGVTLKGGIEVGKNCYRPNDYNVGLLCGAGSIAGIDMSGITVTVEDPENNSAKVEVNPETGEVTLTFAD